MALFTVYETHKSTKEAGRGWLGTLAGGWCDPDGSPLSGYLFCVRRWGAPRPNYRLREPLDVSESVKNEICLEEHSLNGGKAIFVLNRVSSKQEGRTGGLVYELAQVCLNSAKADC